MHRIAFWLLAHAASALVVTPLRPAPTHSCAAVARTSIVQAVAEREVSDVETAGRWIGVQACVDISILLIVALDIKNKAGGEELSFDRYIELALASPGLKFLILMPALTVFLQILRRFGDETGVCVRGGSFEEDPIVKFLGGAEKVRSIRSRWLEMTTVKAK